MNRRAFGDAGEEAACAYLKKQGMRILARNVRRAHGEIDIIARDRKTLVFVEVKRRSGLGFGTPAEAVNAQKRRRIISAATAYLQEENLWDEDVRFDIVEILPEQLRLIKGAFDAGGL